MLNTAFDKAALQDKDCSDSERLPKVTVGGRF